MKIAPALFACALPALAAESDCANIKGVYNVPAAGSSYLPAPREGTVVVSTDVVGVTLTWKSEGFDDLNCLCPGTRCFEGTTRVDLCTCWAKTEDDLFIKWAHRAMRTLQVVDSSNPGNPELHTLMGVIKLSPAPPAPEQTCDWYGAYKVEVAPLPGWTKVALEYWGPQQMEIRWTNGAGVFTCRCSIQACNDPVLLQSCDCEDPETQAQKDVAEFTKGLTGLMPGFPDRITMVSGRGRAELARISDFLGAFGASDFLLVSD